MSNDGSGCIYGLLGLLLLAVVVGIAIAETGLPNWDGALTWDTAATADRQETARLDIVESNQTERERIRENAETSRTWALGLVSLGVIAVVVVGVVKMVQADAQRQPAPNVYLLPPPQVREALTVLNPSDGYRPEYIDGEWRLVSERRRDWMTVEDVRRLTG